MTDIFNFLGNITEGIDNGIILLDKDYKVIFANKTATSLFGPYNSLINQRCYEFLHQLDVPCHENYKFKTCPHREIILTGKSVTSTHTFVLKNWEKRTFNITASPIKDKDGEVIQIVKILEDVTERKQIEETLRMSEKKYKDLVDNSLAGIYKTDINGDFIYVNNTLVKMFDFDSPDEMINKSALSLNRNFKGSELLIDDLKRTGSVNTIEIKFLTKKGNIRDILMSAALNGDVISGMMIDITERKKMEALAKNQEILFSSIFEGMQDGMIVVNRNFEILYANSSYMGQTGRSPDEINGRYCYEVSHNNTKPCYLAGEECSVKNAFETGTGAKIIHTHFDKNNNPVYVETVAYPIKDFSGNVTSVAERVSNITEKLKLDEELNKRVKELEAFYDMAVGRELRIIELRKEVQKLREELSSYKN